MGTSELLGKPNKLREVTSVPSRRSRNTPSSFMLQKSGYALDTMSQSTPRLHYFLFEGGIAIFL